MSKTPQIIEKLKLIGFTEYTSRAYIALVRLGEATAPDIARESNIPQSKIYGVLDDLYDKGFVWKAGESDKNKSHQTKKKTTSPTIYFAHKPIEKLSSWLDQFQDLAKNLENIYNTSGLTSEYGYTSIGNYTIKNASEKFDAGDFIYIFEQPGDENTGLYSRFFNGRINNHIIIGGEENIVLAVTARNTIMLIEKEARVQYLSIEEPVFSRIIDVLFAITPINRSITNDMSELSREEKILYIDNVPSGSGVAYGNDGILWITEERLFVQMPGRQIYARPIFSIDSFFVNTEGLLTIVIKSKDGIVEENEFRTSSDPSIIVNIIDFIKRCSR